MEVYLRLSRNKPAFSRAKISSRSHAGNFSCPPKRPLGCKNRPERCVFPPTGLSFPKAFSQASGVNSDVGISSRPVWPKRNAPTLPKCHAHFSKKVAKERCPGLHIPGRHFIGRPHPKRITKIFTYAGGGSDNVRVQNQRQKVGATPLSASNPPGFHGGSGGRKVKN